jgi:hypothetical protein
MKRLRLFLIPIAFLTRSLFTAHSDQTKLLLKWSVRVFCARRVNVLVAYVHV